MTDRMDDHFTLLQSMADASPLALAVSEGASHVLRYVNPAFCRLFGRPAGELLGRPFAEACPDEDCGAATALLNRVLETGAAENLADLRRLGPGAAASYWSYAAWPLLDHGGVVTQVSDTTASHLATEVGHGELQRANQQLLLAALREDERSEKLLAAAGAKDEFVAMLAHELRNPLAAVRTGIYLLEQRADPEDSDTRETCAILTHQMRHLSRLLDDLLDVSRITRGKINLQRELVDVVQVLHHAVAASRSLLELQRHELSMSLPPAPVWVDADPVRLEQVVTNLLQNAIKYMEAGGHVWLSLETVPGETGSDIQSAAGVAVIRVRDAGIGISPDALLHIFDLFGQADPADRRDIGGLGIGLTLVKRLVELHGGSVDAHSAGLGLGSEFRVLLPMPDGAEASKQPAQPPSVVPSGAVKILLAEDNVAAAVTLAEVLELWGHDVRIAYNGEKALSAAAEACPDVALLDIGLPGMDGYEVARRLRALPAMRDTLLVALTGYGQDADRERSREAGFDYHLTKPVDLDELRRVLTAPPLWRGGDKAAHQDEVTGAANQDEQAG